MKAFIAVTLLAACVAAQTIDQTQTGYVSPLLLQNSRKELGLGDLLNNYWGQQVESRVNGQFTTILSIDELVRTNLFQTYYALPLFRQHFSHPLFQVYLTTPTFQKYWVLPEFQTFFRNPYLFYKYVYPVIFNVEQTLVDNKEVLGLGDKTFETVQVPTVWNKYTQTQTFPYTLNTMNLKQVQMKLVLDNIVKAILINNKPELTLETLKPILDQDILVKIVDPITGEVKYTVGDIKTVGDKLVRVRVEDLVTFVKVIDTLVKENKIYITVEDLNVLIKTIDTILKEKLTRLSIDTPIDTLTGEKVIRIGDQIIRVPSEDVTIDTLVEDKMIRVPVERLNQDTIVRDDLVKDLILKKFLNKFRFGNKKIVDTVDRTFLPIPINFNNMKKIETLPIVDKYEKLNEELVFNKYGKQILINKMNLNEEIPKTELINEQIFLNKNVDVPTMDKLKEMFEIQKIQKLGERIELNKFETIPTLNRARRHAVYTQQPTYTTVQKNAKALNYYTVPLTYQTPITYGVQTPYTYGIQTPVTYNTPLTYTNQVQPALYYPGQTIYA